MQINNPEHIDTFFKKHLEKLPVDYKESSWDKMNQLLEKPTKINKTSPKYRMSGLKFITGFLVIVSAILLFVWKIQIHQSKQVITPENSDSKKDSVSKLKHVPTQDSVQYFEIKISRPKKDSAESKSNPKTNKTIYSDTLKSKSKDKNENNDVFW